MEMNEIEWIRICGIILRISKAPFLILTSTVTHHQKRQIRKRRFDTRCPSASRPQPSPGPSRDELQQRSRRGQGVCGCWCSTQIKCRQTKHRSTSQGFWWLSIRSCCPLPDSDSLIAVGWKILYRAGEKFSAYLQLIVTLVYT